jgi:hypothetical protein
MNKFIIFLIFILLACSGSKENMKGGTRDQIQYNESFDPLSLNDDDIIISEDVPVGKEEINKTENSIEQQLNHSQTETSGWRVQIEATSDIKGASLVVQEAKDLFKSQGYNTYLIYESSLYKIRIGDCIERSCAEKLQDLARNYGYRQAFLVKSKVVDETKNK